MEWGAIRPKTLGDRSLIKNPIAIPIRELREADGSIAIASVRAGMLKLHPIGGTLPVFEAISGPPARSNIFSAY
jgi:hypothetical protein